MMRGSAERILSNAKIYTCDTTRPWADTAVIRGGRLSFVGEQDELTRGESISAFAARTGATVHELGGRVVLPGIIDAHTHPSSVAASRWHVALPVTDDLDEILDFIRRYGIEHPRDEAPYLHFEYYPTTLFGDGAPTKELLDTAISDRPVLCQDSGDHASWVNSRMLELLGVTADTPDPAAGLQRFVRDAHGEPTGHVLEHANAPLMDRLYAAIGWEPPEAPTADLLEPVLDFFTRHGVTSLFDAIIADEIVLETLTELEAAGRLRLHYEGAVRFTTMADLPAAIATAHEYQTRYGSPLIRIRTLKLFLDGTNELGNSAVIDPLCHEGDAGPHGAIQMETAELAACLSAMNDADLDLHIHMVGDRAFRVGCDAVESARARAAELDSPWRIGVTFSHCELVDPSDTGRPARLGITVNWTPHWSGGYFGEEGRQFLGDERWHRMYEFNAIADAGAMLTFASDVVSTYELHRADPFFGMQVAATRVDPESPLDPDRFPGSVRPAAASRLALERLIRGYTIDAARQLRLDDRTGSLVAGKDADLIVLSEDIFELDPSAYARVAPTAVCFAGEVIAGAF